jgi:hypothetical protein
MMIGTVVSVCILNRSKSHCKRGHEFTEENTRLQVQRATKPGQSDYLKRVCKTCHREANREISAKPEQRERDRLRLMDGEPRRRVFHRRGWRREVMTAQEGVSE